ncbi:MAG: type II toxin-antitoxin system HicA family toxin [Chloroflexi bacterium]|nr:type II toxin-antitoxin system HicA family toxin [Chloroflexota bacterium]
MVRAPQTGAHLVLKHPSRAGRAVVPRHAGVTIPPKVLASVLDGTGLTADQFRGLL